MFIYFEILNLFQLRRVIFQFSMETDSFDIDHYVPFKSLEDIHAFCDPSDGMLLKKKNLWQRGFLRPLIHPL